MLFLKQNLRSGLENHCFRSGLIFFFFKFCGCGVLGHSLPLASPRLWMHPTQFGAFRSSSQGEACVQRDLCRLTCPDERAPRRRCETRLVWISLWCGESALAVLCIFPGLLGGSRDPGNVLSQ